MGNQQRSYNINRGGKKWINLKPQLKEWGKGKNPFDELIQFCRKMTRRWLSVRKREQRCLILSMDALMETNPHEAIIQRDQEQPIKKKD